MTATLTPPITADGETDAQPTVDDLIGRSVAALDQARGLAALPERDAAADVLVRIANGYREAAQLVHWQISDAQQQADRRRNCRCGNADASDK